MRKIPLSTMFASADPEVSEILAEIVAEIAARERDRPVVTLAFAQSLNGMLAAARGVRTLLSGPEAQEFTHELRAIHDAIAVGVGTVLADNPRLTCRNGRGSLPQPIIFDSNLRTPPDARVFREHRRVILVCSEAARRKKADRFDLDRTVFFPAGMGEDTGAADSPGAADGPATRHHRQHRPLAPVLKRLREEFGLATVMVEGGALLFSSFFSEACFDLVAATVSARVMGGYPLTGERAAVDRKLVVRHWLPMGSDIVLLATRAIATSRDNGG